MKKVSKKKKLMYGKDENFPNFHPSVSVPISPDLNCGLCPAGARANVKHTNSDHEKLARPHHVHDSFSVGKHLEHHLLLSLGGRFVFRMRARMNDSVHVEVEIVKLLHSRVNLRSKKKP